MQVNQIHIIRWDSVIYSDCFSFDETKNAKQKNEHAKI